MTLLKPMVKKKKAVIKRTLNMSLKHSSVGTEDN